MHQETEGNKDRKQAIEMKKLLIFDLDGTILNTLDDLADSTNYALRKHGLPERTLTEVRAFVGNGIGKLIERAVPEDCSETVRKSVLESFSAHYKKHSADKTRPYDGILEVLRELKGLGYQMAIVSNKADPAVHTLCEHYFPEIFTFVTGEQEGIGRKPSPDSVFAVLEQLNTEKRDAVYIGDSEVDAMTAQNAGVDLIAVEWGFRDREVLEAKGAKVILKTPDEILSTLQRADELFG